MEFLADTAEAVSVKEVAEYFQLPNSHICRLLKSLAEAGYVEQLPGSRKYRVSLKILNLANARLKKEHLLGIARPYMRQLAEKVDGAVFVTFHLKNKRLPYELRQTLVFLSKNGKGREK